MSKNKDVKIEPIPLANNIPPIGTKAQHVCIPEEKNMEKDYINSSYSKWDDLWS